VKEYTQIEDREVEIWRRAYQRSMNLTVRPDGRVRVTCGRRMRLGEVSRFVRESELFIQKRLLELEAQKRRHPEKQYVSGEPFLYLGVRLPLEIVWTWTERIKVAACDQCLEMLAPIQSTRDERRRAMHEWYRRTSRERLHARVAARAAEMRLFPRGISIRGQRTRWGSCSERGEISLNWKLLAAPVEVMDYVVVHELAHLRHLDHSPRFWDLVAGHHPGHKSARAWLRVHEFEIATQFRV
jgi:predicted metal-dependent hydrolase